MSPRRHRGETLHYSRSMIACRVLGHRWRFSSVGNEMRWACGRDCGAGGSKRYETAEQAARYARAFDREDTQDLGKRPTLSTLPLWLARRAARKR
jgi:hypothetical protein